MVQTCATHYACTSPASKSITTELVPGQVGCRRFLPLDLERDTVYHKRQGIDRQAGLIQLRGLSALSLVDFNTPLQASTLEQYLGVHVCETLPDDSHLQMSCLEVIVCNITHAFFWTRGHTLETQ